ncbi:hypothetical protein LDL77_06375 [Flagellimonas marinaquae]|uniref:hypothetical protein n=1 Tax=Flagellimonas aurea TaxID=2915619 RepID=UPI001CE03E96|nr:hypothetical protein LDL77_06375 [Allomuricauda aquimarina]
MSAIDFTKKGQATSNCLDSSIYDYTVRRNDSFFSPKSWLCPDNVQPKKQGIRRIRKGEATVEFINELWPSQARPVKPEAYLVEENVHEPILHLQPEAKKNAVALTESIKIKEDIVREILSFKSLKDNWDGYGAIPLEIESALNAVNFIFLLDRRIKISPEDIYPNPNGTISMSWVSKNNDVLNLEIGNTSLSYYHERNNGIAEINNDVEITPENIREISKIILLFQANA